MVLTFGEKLMADGITMVGAPVRGERSQQESEVSKFLKRIYSESHKRAVSPVGLNTSQQTPPLKGPTISSLTLSH